MKRPEPDDLSKARISIAATTPLRHTGILRILSDAGMAPSAEGDGGVEVTVRTADDPPTGSPIELSVGAGDVHLRLTSSPDRGAWETIARLVAVLFGATGADDTKLRSSPRRG
jgi:hypothetical protein